GAALLVGSIGMLIATGRSMDPFYRNVAAVGAIFLGMGLPVNVMSATFSGIGRCAYGIYLSHPAIIVLGRHLLGRDDKSLAGFQIAFLGVFAVAGSIAVTAVIQLSPLAPAFIPLADAKRRNFGSA